MHIYQIGYIKKIYNYFIFKFRKVQNKKLIEYKNNINEKTCTICIEEFLENEQIYLLKCNHIYHINCIDEWILKTGESKVKCPNCNKLIYDELNEPFI